MVPTDQWPGLIAADPRILKVQIERVSKALRGTIARSPLWVCLFAYLCTQATQSLGKVPLTRVGMLVAIIWASSLFGFFALRRLDERRAEDAGVWCALIGLSALLSTAWGLAPWLLWDEVNNANHVFIELMSLAIVARVVVNRASHLPFFIASFAPMASLLFLRCIAGFQPVDMVLAALVPMYAVQIFFDTRQISQRWDQEALMRFSHEDLTRELEEARDEALLKRAEAEAANLSKTQFLANMSHELRTPLNAILGFSEIIARECLGPVGSPRYKEYAGDIHQSGTHLLSLINDLLDVAKIEAGRMEIEPHMIETQRTLDNALKFVAVKARQKSQILTITVDDDASILFADERALKQIVINLVSNAVKFTPDGGRIEVRGRRNPAGDFELMVADNGPGIPRDKIDRIFKPFSRVDNRYDSEAGGTGLGLALVRGLAELHDGRAWIESEQGKGTRVFVVLPMTSTHHSVKLRA